MRVYFLLHGSDHQPPRAVPMLSYVVTKQKCTDVVGAFLLGDPYGNRTHVTAVKGRCLSRLTNGPGSGDWT